MAGISEIRESIFCTVGAQLHTVATSSKRWVVLAGIVTGWAVGFFFASKAILMPEEQVALMGITSYAFARLALDAMTYLDWLAIWLLNRAGDEGKMQLSSIGCQVLDV